jgi:hypothetical protein
MQPQPSFLRAIAFAVGFAALFAGSLAFADPPSRVARLGYVTGAVSFSPAGESDWVQATLNRPLTAGDRLWADARARAEVQVGGAMIRMSADTGMSILNLDDRIAQVQLSQGVLSVRVRRLDAAQVIEVDTPNLAYTFRQPGEFRIEVDPDGNATTIIVRKGRGEAYGDGAAYVIDARQSYRFTGTGLREYAYFDAVRADEFDRWSSDRDRRFDNSVSARYVSQDVVGYQDLDANGTWRVDRTYGSVWVPNRVAADWAPYRDGHWAWVDPWGWTWVDDAPWGFAVSHYGRWANLDGTWGWVPGPVQSRAYYAPALVAFVGGANFKLAISGNNVGGVAWFPLGPRDVYRPSYVVSRGYFENVNRSNTVISNTVINNYYNNTNVTNVVYANRQVPGAIVAVPSAAFVQSQQVGRSAVRVTEQMVASAPVAVVAPVAPTQSSVRGAAAQGGKPPDRAFERPIVARTAPAPAHAGFAAQQQQLASKPGKPLEESVRRELKPAAAVPVPVVRVVGEAQKAPPAASPPPVAGTTTPAIARGRPDEPKAPGPPTPTAAPGTPAPASTAKPIAAPPAPSAPPAQAREQPGRADPRGKGNEREPSTAPQTAPQRPAAPASAIPSQGTLPPVAAPPAEQPGKADRGNRGEARGQTTPPQSLQQTTPVPPPAAREPSAPPKPEAVPAVKQPPPQAKPEPMPVARQPPAPPMPEAVPAVKQPPPQAKPEPVPVARQPEPRPPVAAPNPPQAQPASQGELRAREPKPAAAKPEEKKKTDEEKKKDEEDRKQKGQAPPG